MNCRKCSSARVLSCFGKSNDCNGFHIQGEELDDQCYVLRDCNIGGGDFYAFDLCLDCGQVQGDWPVPPLDFELRKTQGGVCDRCMGDDTCVCVMEHCVICQNEGPHDTDDRPHVMEGQE